MKIKCVNCNYEWETKSELKFVTCPNCQRKFEKNKKKEEQENEL